MHLPVPPALLLLRLPVAQPRAQAATSFVSQHALLQSLVTSCSCHSLCCCCCSTVILNPEPLCGCASQPLLAPCRSQQKAGGNKLPASTPKSQSRAALAPAAPATAPTAPPAATSSTPQLGPPEAPPARASAPGNAASPALPSSTDGSAAARSSAAATSTSEEAPDRQSPDQQAGSWYQHGSVNAQQLQQNLLRPVKLPPQRTHSAASEARLQGQSTAHYSSCITTAACALCQHAYLVHKLSCTLNPLTSKATTLSSAYSCQLLTNFCMPSIADRP